MAKDDVKAIVLIFIILLLISGIGMLGYIFLIENTDIEPQKLFQGVVLNKLPEKEENTNSLTSEDKTEILNQIASSSSQTQVAQPNTQTEQEGYYYKQLNSYEKIIYDALKNNKENLKSGTYRLDFGDSFDKLLVEENGADLLQEYYQSGMETYLYDNPEIFYLAPTKMYINIHTTKKFFVTSYEVFLDSGENANYLAEGYTSKEQIIECENQIEQEVQKILSKTLGKTDYQKMLIIHDYLVENLIYEETVSKANIYNIYGALVNQECVCEGYAKAFKYLLDKIGIENIVIIGKATDSNDETQNHAWNYVNFDNNWYAVDVTWDDPIIIGGGTLSKKNKYKYFLKGSTTMRKDHEESNTFIENGRVYTHPILSVTDYE